MGKRTAANTDDAHRALKRFFDQYSLIPAEEWKKFAERLEMTEIRKSGYFARIGDERHKIGLVIQGCFQVSYLSSGGSRHIRNFCPEETLVSSYSAALRGMACDVDIQAIEPACVVSFDYVDFRRTLRRHQSWERLGRKLVEKYFLFRECREYQFLLEDADERYERFLIDFGAIKHRLKHADIAAYVGMTPTSFSRLLNKRNSKKGIRK